MSESYHAILWRKTLRLPHQIVRRLVRITMKVVLVDDPESDRTQMASQKIDLIRELREEHARLARSLAEKEVLIKEVHHRVKNNLQIVASLLHLQAQATPDQTAAAVLRESQHRVEAMAMIHEHSTERQISGK